MNRLPQRAGSASALMLACLFAAGRAPAESADQCVEANTAAQSLQRDGKLGAAREKLKRCLDPSCPGLVRDDCAQRLDDLDRIQPTMVFDVKDGDGHDLADVKVTMDGQPFAEHLAGIALAVDPGEHAFTFETAGVPPLVQRFVVKQGEKGRRERIVLGPSGAKTVALTPAAEPESGLGTQRTVALAVFGAGLVALGAGVALAVEAKQKDNDADAICPGTTCDNAEGQRANHDARTAGNWATAAFLVGAAGIGGATILWLTAKPTSENPSVSIGLAGGIVRLRGTW